MLFRNQKINLIIRQQLTSRESTLFNWVASFHSSCAIRLCTRASLSDTFESSFACPAL